MTDALKSTEIAAASASALTERPSSSRVLRRLRHERKAIVGLIIVAVLALIAVLGPLLAPYHPDADDFTILEAPSLQHPMGTDSFGRDLLSRLIVGTRVSFFVGVLAAVVALVV